MSVAAAGMTRTNGTAEPIEPTVLTAAGLAAWVRRTNDLVNEHADELTELDAAIGDADHGTNMKRGLAAAVEALRPVPETPEAVLKRTAMALISKVGGASGPLYGTFFLRMAAATAGRSDLDLAALADAVEAGVGGIAQRGRAEPGEKTMLDAWLRHGPARGPSSGGRGRRCRTGGHRADARRERAGLLPRGALRRAHRSRGLLHGSRRARPRGGRRWERHVIGLVLVSHSRELARAALELAVGLVPGLDVRVELAAGLSGGGLGTDATEIAAAVGRADDGDGILVLTDLGSGIMSAETALELLDPGVAARVRLSPAPLVEGLVGAYAAAGIGKTLDDVAAEAETAIEAKRVQLTT